MTLFNSKVLERFTKNPAPIPEKHAQILEDWATAIRTNTIENLKETALYSDFTQRLVVDILGYTPPTAAKDGSWTVDHQHTIGKGAVDIALGIFSNTDDTVLAPVELKSAKIKDLDAIMAGRNKSPVQQAWEYANAASGARWVLVSNYLELRLYSYNEGTLKFETFDFLKLTDPAEYARFYAHLAAENLLDGKTEALLQDSKREDKKITDALYREYKEIRNDLIDDINAHPCMDALEAIGHAQTILDRVLFIAFAEDTGLLPEKTLKRAYNFINPYAPIPAPVWNTFKALFRSIDKGNPALGIHRYNGGLFQHNPDIEKLELSDAVCEGFKKLGDYDFASEISVTILGHIFEQSISDLERLQAQVRGEEVEPEKTSGTTGQRKKHGVVYTPDYITRFIVERTVGAHLSELFADVVSKFATKASTVDDYENIKWKSQKAELNAWTAYRDRLAALKIVDPACGSGAFLVAAFDYLKAEYNRVNTKIADLSPKKMANFFDPDREILTHNLYGVDVNAESVEITKLSLWLKTARPGKILDSLDHNIRVGDSLIEDANYAYLEHAFNWKDAFPEVFEEGGFDIVLGNPPYVRMGLITHMKPYLETRFGVYHGNADLFCYFYERGVRLLKGGGRLGYISNATFFKTSSGLPLRKYLAAHSTIETIVDFGDIQIFEGVATLPAVLILKNQPPKQTDKLFFWNVDQLSENNFSKAFEIAKTPFSLRHLSEQGWELEDERLTELRDKIKSAHTIVSEHYGSPYRGILTGRNTAFVIDEKKKNELVTADPKSGEIIKPFLEGKDIKGWRMESRSLYVIFTRRGIDIEQYPALLKYLEQFREILEPKPRGWQPSYAGEKWKGRKSGSYKWYEIQDSVDYHQQFSEPKIIYAHFNRRYFAYSDSEAYCNDKGYIIPNAGRDLLAFLMSNCLWFILKNQAPQVIGGSREVRTYFIDQLPIPAATNTQKAELGTLAEQCQAAAEERYAVQSAVRNRIPDLCPIDREPKLNTKLKDWWLLDDFAAFQKQIKTAFKTEIPLKDRNDWDAWLGEQKAEVLRLDGEIARLENEINARVYDLFGLTDDESALLEANI
ncbi:N-6 DNA methylase [Magnetovibrio sp. PR-2]|uniref:Eco57I restriction-modification methylase domain-containing protein n=1 Tax=Magnetovibrio sp. PR-2 TaxID=3120356 RepID=UPI002FCDE7D9